MLSNEVLKMIKRVISFLLFCVIVVIVFNLFDLIFDRFVSHTPFTFDSLSNILLPLVIAVLILLFFKTCKKIFRQDGKKVK